MQTDRWNRSSEGIWRSIQTLGQYLDQHATVLAILLAIAFVVVQIPFLVRYPVVHQDEPWDANRAWRLLQTGQNSTTIDVGPRADDVGITGPPLATALLAASYRFFGLGLWQTRLPALIFGGVLLLGVYWTGNTLYNRLTGLLALVLLGLSPFFLLSSHLGRPDIVLAALVMAAFGCTIWSYRANRLAPNLLAGFLIGLSYSVHQNSLLFIAALTICYPVLLGARFWRDKTFWLFVVGGLAGTAVYGTIFRMLASLLGSLIPGIAPANAGSLSVHGLAGTHRPPIADPTPLRLVQSFLAEVYYRYHPSENIIPLLLIGGALIFLAWRRRKSDQVLLAFTGAAFVLSVFLVQNKVDHYTILFYPYLMIALAAAFASHGPVRLPRWAKAMLVVGVVVLLFNGVVKTALELRDQQDYSYYAVTERIREVLPKQARVLGRPVFWLGLTEYDYRSTFTLTDYHYLRGYSLTQGLEALQPDYVIVDKSLLDILSDTGFAPPTSEGGVLFQLPRQELEAFLGRQASRILQFQDPWHGLIEVYAIHWN